MESSQIYLAISLALLAIVALLMLIRSKKVNRKEFSPLTAIAIGCVLAGFIFSDNHFIGYSLIGIGVLLAFIDIFFKQNKDQQ